MDSVQVVGPAPAAGAGWRGRGARLLVLAAMLLSFGNAAAYIAYASNPLAVADAWYFINAFLAKAYDGGFDLVDLYVKRPGADHAQPLQKLLLLANARWFGLDFVVESYMGLAMALATFLALWRITSVDARARGLDPWLHAALCGAMAGFLVSLNAGSVFNWSLVTLGYLPHLFLVLAAAACWRSLHGRGSGMFALAFGLMAFTLDNMAMITGAALLASAALACGREKLPPRRLALVAALVAAPLVAYAMASRFYLHAGLAVDPGGAPVSLTLLLSHAPKMLTGVLASSVAYPLPLQFYLDATGASKVEGVLGVALALAHLWFWWAALRKPWNRTMFVAVSMMLTLYASVAGILYGRVPTFGPEYIYQPRYVLTYQMGPVALILMLLGTLRPPGSAGTRALAAALLCATLALQVMLSRYSWDEARYIQGYIHTMARQMYLMGLDPEAPLASCVPNLSVCEYPVAERVQAIEFLRDHHLNAYSPSVLRRYRLEAVASAPHGYRVVERPESQ
ncbi:hypothetical protein [Pseudoxanthomonas sp. Soil82]|uniref:hypothetical protein n=1 Tax=Pseudoxanthomonas sp. Soil82 TaxID=3157341 RepID=UPI00338FE40F